MSDDRADFDLLNPPNSDTDIPSVPALKPADTLISNKINAIPIEPGMLPDNEVPGLLQEMRRVVGRLHPDDWRSQEGAVKQLRMEYNAAYQAQQQQHRLQAQERQDYFGKIDSEWTPRLNPRHPNPITIDEVLTDPRFKDGGKDGAALQQRFMALIDRQSKEDPALINDNANKLEIYSKMLQPYGTPDKITTKADLDYRLIYGQITERSHDWLLKNLLASQTVEGEKLIKPTERLIKAAGPKILGPMALDKESQMQEALQAQSKGRPSAVERLNSYTEALNAEIQNYREAKKDPASLFDSSKPDYFGSDEKLKAYLPTPKDKFTPTPLPQKTGQKDIQDMTQEELFEFGSRNDVTRAAALREAIRRGIHKPSGPTDTGAPLR